MPEINIEVLGEKVLKFSKLELDSSSSLDATQKLLDSEDILVPEWCTIMITRGLQETRSTALEVIREYNADQLQKKLFPEEQG